MALVLGLMIDIDATAVCANPELQTRCQQVGDEGVDIGNARRGIIQVFDNLAARCQQLQAKRRSNGNLSGSQLGDGLHVVYIIIIGVTIGGFFQ